MKLVRVGVGVGGAKVQVRGRRCCSAAQVWKSTGAARTRRHGTVQEDAGAGGRWCKTAVGQEGSGMPCGVFRNRIRCAVGCKEVLLGELFRQRRLLERVEIG